jgi:hypothetical protein
MNALQVYPIPTPKSLVVVEAKTCRRAFPAAGLCVGIRQIEALEGYDESEARKEQQVKFEHSISV